MTYVNPLHVPVRTNRIRDSVERIAADTVSSLNSCIYQNIYKQISYSLCHVFAFLSPFSVLNSLRRERRANEHSDFSSFPSPRKNRCVERRNWKSSAPAKHFRS
jgi:hypothetical protein